MEENTVRKEDKNQNSFSSKFFNISKALSDLEICMAKPESKGKIENTNNYIQIQK